MNLLQLVMKQMRQRALSTSLTGLSILLGMMLATSVLILSRESRNVFAQTDYGFEMLVGPKASPLQLVLNTIYHMDVSPGNVPYRLYEDMVSGRELSGNGAANPFRGRIAWAVPYAVGDSYMGRRIVGTTPQLFGVDDAGKALPAEKVPHYRGKEAYGFAEGRAFAANKFEAVVGWEVAKTLGLHVGSTFQATHGVPRADFVPLDVHPETWKVVGVLRETRTANDRVLFIPLMTFYAIFEHEEGLEQIAEIKGAATMVAGSKAATASKPAVASAAATAAEEKVGYTLNGDGTINLKLPKEEWEVSAILVQTKSYGAFSDVQFALKNLPEAIAVSPAKTMAEFFDAFLPKVAMLLLIISTLVTVVAGVSILVSIYNSVTARNREIAIMRALGATRVRILAAVCLEAGLVGVFGGVVGLVAGHVLAAGGSAYLRHLMGSGIAWWYFDGRELVYLGVVVGVSLLAGLVPAMKAYRTPVAENLVAG